MRQGGELLAMESPGQSAQLAFMEPLPTKSLITKSKNVNISENYCVDKGPCTIGDS
jgi:hypothetical protein